MSRTRHHAPARVPPGGSPTQDRAQGCMRTRTPARCLALQGGAALERLDAMGAGPVRWSRRCRGARTPRPRIERDGRPWSRGGGTAATAPIAQRDPTGYQGEGRGGRAVEQERGSASSSAPVSSSLAHVGAHVPALRIEGAPRCGLIHVLERSFGLFLAIWLFLGRLVAIWRNRRQNRFQQL